MPDSMYPWPHTWENETVIDGIIFRLCGDGFDGVEAELPSHPGTEDWVRYYWRAEEICHEHGTWLEQVESADW